jgi:hypothetical protein
MKDEADGCVSLDEKIARHGCKQKNTQVFLGVVLLGFLLYIAHVIVKYDVWVY